MVELIVYGVTVNVFRLQLKLLVRNELLKSLIAHSVFIVYLILPLPSVMVQYLLNPVIVTPVNVIMVSLYALKSCAPPIWVVIAYIVWKEHFV
jgi:type III secretory pathway component EscV